MAPPVRSPRSGSGSRRLQPAEFSAAPAIRPGSEVTPQAKACGYQSIRCKIASMIRAATAADTAALAGLIRELAEYEKLAHAVELDEARLGEHLFGPRPLAEALVAED